jgi:hypothetical protein
MSFKDKFLLGAWNIGIVEATIDRVFKHPIDMKIRWLKHKYQDRYFADPFLENQDQKYYYVLAEEYIFCLDKANISRLTIEKSTMKLVGKETILNDDYHLSYPFIYNDCIIPEGYRSQAAYAYKKTEGGQKYQKIKLVDEPLVDPTLLCYDDKFWLFATTRKTPEEARNMLSIFYAGKMGPFTAHGKNPVKIDIKTARPGGRFFEHQGKLFRPAMDCEESYGHRIRIMEVKKLSTDEYEEQEVLVLPVKHAPPYELGFHTFNVYENCILIDGYREYHSYFLKPCLIKLKPLMQFIYKQLENPGKEIITAQIRT